ncbi:hypothetical protein HK099_001759 [Clydaea vesicula]|uniref:PH domain-containing protein n=1 Tax=Clydaea vesicula TaxID=447962 RepID=A0AAD5U371_9FUNG|nr:hypothetical protein HK099_001759 [Clydaea vesicula]
MSLSSYLSQKSNQIKRSKTPTSSQKEQLQAPLLHHQLSPIKYDLELDEEAETDTPKLKINENHSMFQDSFDFNQIHSSIFDDQYENYTYKSPTSTFSYVPPSYVNPVIVTNEFIKPHPADISREGWLEYNAVSTTWREYYAISTHHQNEAIFQLYLDDLESKPFKVIFLKQCLEIQAVKECGPSNYQFTLSFNGLEYNFRTEHLEDSSCWVKTLNMLINPLPTDISSSEEEKKIIKTKNTNHVIEAEKQIACAAEGVGRILDQKLDLALSKLAEVMEYKSDSFLIKLKENLAIAEPSNFTTPKEIETLNQNNTTDITNLETTLVELTDSMEMRTNKIAKMVHQLIQKTADKEDLTGLVKEFKDGQSIILHLKDSIVPLFEMKNDVVKNLNAINKKFDDSLKLDNTTPISNNQIDNSSKVLDLTEKIFGIIKKLESDFVMQKTTSGNLVTESFLIQELKSVISCVHRDCDTMSLKEALVADRAKFAEEIFYPKLDHVIEIIDFVSKTQCKMVDLMTQKFKDSFSNTDKTKSSVEQKQSKNIVKSIESLHSIVEEGTQQTQDSLDNISLQIGESSNKDENLFDLLKQMNDKIDIQNQKSTSIEKLLTKQMEKQAELENKVDQLKVEISKCNNTSLTEKMQQLYPRPNFESSVGLPNTSCNPLILSMNDKMLALTDIVEQMRESSNGRMLGLEEKLRWIIHNNSNINDKASEKLGSTVNEEVIELKNGITEIENRLSRSFRETQANQVLNEGWFNRIVELTKNVLKKSCENEILIKDLNLNNSIVSSKQEIVKNFEKNFKDFVHIFQKGKKDEEDIKIKLEYDLDKILKIVSLNEKKFDNNFELIEKIFGSTIKEQDLSDIKTNLNNISERTLRFDNICQNMPDNLVKDIDLILRNLNFVMEKLKLLENSDIFKNEKDNIIDSGETDLFFKQIESSNSFTYKNSKKVNKIVSNFENVKESNLLKSSSSTSLVNSSSSTSLNKNCNNFCAMQETNNLVKPLRDFINEKFSKLDTWDVNLANLLKLIEKLDCKLLDFAIWKNCNEKKETSDLEYTNINHELDVLKKLKEDLLAEIETITCEKNNLETFKSDNIKCVNLTSSIIESHIVNNEKGNLNNRRPLPNVPFN